MSTLRRSKPTIRDSLTQETLTVAGLLKHHPLPNESSIRVLELKGLRSIVISSPSEYEPCWFQEIPTLSIQTIALQDTGTGCHSYDALSYCWNLPHEPAGKLYRTGWSGGKWYDDEYPSEQSSDVSSPYVDCDGSLVVVKPNISAALLQLSKMENPRVLWVDSLCINQHRSQERSQQVSSMGEIYASAEQVIAWLGDSDVVSELWNYLRQCAVRPTRAERFASRVLSDLYRPEYKQFFGGEGFQAGVTYMSYCGWFTRAWTFQESVLAKRIIVRSGSQQIDWSLLYRYWVPLVTDACGFDRPDLCPSSDILTGHLDFIEKTRGDDQSRLLFLLRAIWTRAASVARDKVFSILGLHRGITDLRADYRLTTREVMVAASRACILQDQNLDTLLFAGMTILRGNQYQDLSSRRRRRNATMTNLPTDGNWHVPSWVVDWGSVPSSYEVFSTEQIDEPKLDLRSISDDWRFNVRWDGEHLIAKGVALGRGGLTRHELGFSHCLVPFPSCIGAPRLSDIISTKCYPLTDYDVPGMCMALRSHDQRACTCRPAIQPQSGQQSTRPSPDWVCLLFGATAPFVLRPDGRFSNPSEDAGLHVPAWETLTPHLLSDLFVLVDNYNLLQSFFRHLESDDPEILCIASEMASKMSCVVADFVIR